MRHSEAHYTEVHSGLARKVLQFQQTQSSAAFRDVEKELTPLVNYNANQMPVHQRDDAKTLLLLAAWRAVKEVKNVTEDTPSTEIIRFVSSVLKRTKLHMLGGFSHYRGVEGELDTSFRNEYPGHKLSLVSTEAGSENVNLAGAFSEQVLEDPYSSSAIDRLTTEIAVQQMSKDLPEFDQKVLELLQQDYNAGEIANILDTTYFRIRNARARLAKLGLVQELVG